MSTEVKQAFDQLVNKRDLTRDQARAVFEKLMAGELPEATIAALLGALSVKGESAEEVVGAAEAMRAAMTPVACKAGCIDTCGAGGDGISTFNVSTTAAIMAAAAGATVAKHGNRSISRVSGSTEVLAQLGIDVDASTNTVETCLARAGIGYLNARLLHPAMRYAAPVRQAIPVRTIFNLLGPLTNPAGVRRQVLGVPRPDLLDLMSDALRLLGAEHAWVVHGDDGLCDLTITAPTTVVEVRDGSTRRFTVTPEGVGLPRAALGELLVDSPAASAARIKSILHGERGAPRDHALLNAGAALVVAGLAEDLAGGVEAASQAIDNGAAIETLEQWRAFAGASSATGPGRRVIE